MAASKEARESPSLNAKMSKITCQKSEIQILQPKCSKELLQIEHNAVSKDVHISNMFHEKPTQSGSKPLISRMSRSAALNKVTSFLPLIKQANDEINTAIANGADPSSFHIDNVDESDQFVDMNLALVEHENDAMTDSGRESDDDSSDSELENDDHLCRPEHKTKIARKIIEEIDPSTPAGRE